MISGLAGSTRRRKECRWVRSRRGNGRENGNRRRAKETVDPQVGGIAVGRRDVLVPATVEAETVDASAAGRKAAAPASIAGRMA